MTPRKRFLIKSKDRQILIVAIGDWCCRCNYEEEHLMKKPISRKLFNWFLKKGIAR